MPLELIGKFSELRVFVVANDATFGLVSAEGEALASEPRKATEECSPVLDDQQGMQILKNCWGESLSQSALLRQLDCAQK